MRQYALLDSSIAVTAGCAGAGPHLQPCAPIFTKRLRTCYDELALRQSVAMLQQYYGFLHYELDIGAASLSRLVMMCNLD